MKFLKILASLTLGFICSLSFAQSYPSSTFNNLTINGTLNGPHVAITGGSISGISPAIPVGSGGTGTTTSTGSGSVVLSTSPTMSGVTFTGTTTFGNNITATSSSQFLPNLTFENDFNDANAAYFTQQKTRAGAAVQNHDQLLNIIGKGYTGSTFTNAADISFYTDAAPSGSIIKGKIYLNTTGPLGNLGQWWMYDSSAHVANHQEVNPTLSSCGTSPNLRSGSTDQMGGITVGSGSVTSCTLTFANAYRAQPFCIVSNASSAFQLNYSVTTTALTLTFASGIYSETTYSCQDSSAPGD